MKSLGLISQILVIGLSISVALLYIKPTFDEIGTIQDDVSEYKIQREKIERVNAQLAQHVAQIASISEADRESLSTYMPAEVDDISVMRDLQFIVAEASLIFKGIDYLGQNDKLFLDTTEDLSLDVPEAHEFAVVVEGTYSQIKDFLSLLEQNEYPLEVHDLQIVPIEGGFLSVTVTAVTYANAVVSLDGNS